MDNIIFFIVINIVVTAITFVFLTIAKEVIHKSRKHSVKDIGEVLSENSAWKITHVHDGINDYYELRHTPEDNPSDDDDIIKIDGESLSDLNSLLKKIVI